MLNRIKQLKKSKKGFTLIELVVVLVIIAILAAITVPVVTGYIEDANNSRYVAEAGSIYMVIQTEEASALAKGETPVYTEIVDAANKKISSTTTGASKIVVTTITPITTGTPPAAVVTTGYTVAFTSGSQAIEATITPNDEIVIVKK